LSELHAGPRVLVLTGGLIHLVHQLAVLEDLPECSPSGGEPPRIAVLITGVLTRDAVALQGLQEAIGRWFALLRQRHPLRYGRLTLIRAESALPSGPWGLCLCNNQWLIGQRSVIERLAITDLVVCGDGLGLYYRCGRELRALLPSLLNRPIPEPGRRVRYVLSGRQPVWHRPPQPALAPPVEERAGLFALLVDSQRPEAADALAFCLAGGDPGRPLWLCSVPNLAHQFPGRRIPAVVLQGWLTGLERHHGFDRRSDRLLLIDHPKAPPEGSFAALERPWLGGSLRSAVALEALVQLLREVSPQRRIVVAGLTSALYGVSRLTGAEVAWLGMAPLWWGNPLYRRKPLEFVHRWLRVRRMALLTGRQESSPNQ
jgi:hypothetical protein